MANQSLFDVKFDDLPDPQRVWVGSPGSAEEGLGRLALLTDERVRKAAADEIKLGRRVGLNWEVTKLEYAGFGRQATKHNIVPILGGIAYDDIYTINPQQSSQWDGLRHFGAPNPSDPSDTSKRLFYGGTTTAEILDRSSTRIGIHHWAREGITGRGVLIDYASWAERKGVKYSAFSAHEIKLSELQEIVREQGLVFQRGDILVLRSGTTKEWEGMSEDGKKAYAAQKVPNNVGVEGTRDMARWLWDTGFAAVAGDAIAFEVLPFTGEITLHEWLLPGWGMPIGEIFDLERLAETCKELNRWTFFFASMPLNMPGGISSPPNAQAIF